MNEEKQIEEIWNIITTDCNNECEGCEYENDNWCFSRRVANDIYTAGYRKQSEGEWYVNYMMSKKPSKRGRIIQYTTYTCSVCGKPNGRKKSKFCPECGAKMKGGAE